MDVHDVVAHTDKLGLALMMAGLKCLSYFGPSSPYQGLVSGYILVSLPMSAIVVGWVPSLGPTLAGANAGLVCPIRDGKPPSGGSTISADAADTNVDLRCTTAHPGPTTGVAYKGTKHTGDYE